MRDRSPCSPFSSSLRGVCMEEGVPPRAPAAPARGWRAPTEQCKQRGGRSQPLPPAAGAPACTPARPRHQVRGPRGSMHVVLGRRSLRRNGSPEEWKIRSAAIGPRAHRTAPHGPSADTRASRLSGRRPARPQVAALACGSDAHNAARAAVQARTAQTVERSACAPAPHGTRRRLPRRQRAAAAQPSNLTSAVRCPLLCRRQPPAIGSNGRGRLAIWLARR